MRLWLLVLCATHVWANTALENVGPLLCGVSAPASGLDPSHGQALHASPAPHRAHLPLAAVSEWALYPDVSETWLEKHALLPQAWRWTLTQRYQLRVSAPANVPAEVDLDIQAPEPPASLAAARPCPVINARITVRPTGVAVATHPRTHSWLTRAAAVTLGWAAPTMRAPAAIPVDITFERLYLGVVPATALSMARTMLGVFLLLAIALPLRRPRRA